MTMLPLYICLHSGTSAISHLIEWQTRGAYSHASILLADGRQIEAWSDGVNIRESFRAHGATVDFFSVSATPEQVAAMVAFAENEVGSGYDWVADMCFIIRTAPPEASADRWFCSELVFAAVQAGGIDLFRATQPWEVSPAMLARSPLLIPAASPIANPIAA